MVLRDDSQQSSTDPLTVAAIAIVAFALANLIHEGLGHGATAFLLGGRLEALTSMNLSYEAAGVSDTATRVIASGGTILNLLVASLAFAGLRMMRGLSVQFTYFLWLLATVNLLQGTGYLLFSGMGNIGDWALIIRGWRPWWLWRVALTVLGAGSYWFSVRLALVRLGPLIGSDPKDRLRRANGLMLIPYFTGSLFYVSAGLLNPAGMLLVAVSAAASSLGGTCGLAWGPQLLKDQDLFATHEDIGPVRRSWGWVTTALALGIPIVLLLGPGVSF